MDLREFDLLYNKDSPLYDSTALSNLIYNTLLKEALIRPKGEREVEPKVKKVSTISSTTTHKRKLPYTKYQESFYVSGNRKRHAAFKKECDGSKPTNYDSKSTIQTYGKVSSVESIRERTNSFTPSHNDPESDKKIKEQNENWNKSAPSTCTNFCNSRDNIPFENKGGNIDKNALQSNMKTNNVGFSDTDKVGIQYKFNERKISPDKEPVKDKVLQERTHENKGETKESPSLHSTIHTNVSDLRNKIKETSHKLKDCDFDRHGLPPAFNTNIGETKSKVYEFTDEKNDRHRLSPERNSKRDHTRRLRENIRDLNTKNVVEDNTSVHADSTMAIHTQSGQSAFSQSCSMSSRNALENRTTLNIQDHDNVAQHSGIKQEALGFDDMNYPFGYHNKTSMSSNHSKTPRTNATYSPDVNSNIRIHGDETATINDSITTTSTSASITSHLHSLHSSSAYETPRRAQNVNHLTHCSGTQLHFENPAESHPGSTYSKPQNFHTFETHFGNRISKPQTAHNNDLYYGTTLSKTSTANNYSMDSRTGFANPPYAHNYDLHNRHSVSTSSTEYSSEISRGTAAYMPPAAHIYDMFRVPLATTPATTHRHNLHNKPLNVKPSDAYNYNQSHHPQFAHEHMSFSHGNAASEPTIPFENDFHHGTDVSKLIFAQKPTTSKSTAYITDQLVTKPSSSPHYHGPSQLISSAPIAHQSYLTSHEAIPPNPAEHIPELSMTRTTVESHPKTTISNQRTDTHFEHSPLKVTGPDTNGANSNLESHPRNMDTISNIDNNGASSYCRNTNSQRGYTHKLREAHPTLDTNSITDTHTNTADSTETTSNTLKVSEPETSDSNTSTTKSTTVTNTNKSTEGSIEGCKESCTDNSEVTQSSNSDHSTKIVSSPNRRTNELLSEEEIKAMIEAVVKANGIFEEFSKSEKDEKKPYTIQNEYLNQTQTSPDGTKTQIKEQRKLLVLETTVKYLERKITESVRFAKRIPGFGELPIDDQVNLIKESRTESGIIGGMKGINVKNKVFSANKEIHFSFEDLRLLFSESLLYHKMMLSKRIAALAMNEAEEALLRAISITAPDRCPMLCYSKVDAIQQKLMYCLEYVTTGGGTKPGGARLGKMVDVLIECRYATEVDMKELKSVLKEWSLLSKYKLIDEYL